MQHKPEKKISAFQTLLLALLMSTCAETAISADQKAEKPADKSKNVVTMYNAGAASSSQNFKEIELEGEVVDAWCWSSGVMGPGKGKEHLSCGLACVRGGVSCGIVDDKDNLYICAKHKAYTGCNEMMAPFVSKRVRVKGWYTDRGGCRLIKVAEVKEVIPAKGKK